PFTRFNRFGLALRPLLRDALADPAETIDRFLPRAVQAWRVIAELDPATAKDRNYRADPQPGVFAFGADPQAILDRFFDLGGRHVWGRGHDGYDEMFRKHVKPGDTVVLLVS